LRPDLPVNTDLLGELAEFVENAKRSSAVELVFGELPVCDGVVFFWENKKGLVYCYISYV